MSHVEIGIETVEKYSENPDNYISDMRENMETGNSVDCR